MFSVTNVIKYVSGNLKFNMNLASQMVKLLEHIMMVMNLLESSKLNFTIDYNNFVYLNFQCACDNKDDSWELYPK